MLILGLRLLFSAILITMLIVTTTASLKENILLIPQQVQADPWFQATLYDAYFGFTTFFCWVAYRANSWWAAVFWFIAIMLLGNIAMAGYMLLLLFRLPLDARPKEILLKTKHF
jgi:hypothetical protein